MITDIRVQDKDERDIIILDVFADAKEAVKKARDIYETSVNGILAAVTEIIEQAYKAYPKNSKTNDAALREHLLENFIQPFAESALEFSYPLILIRPYYFLRIEEQNYDYERRNPNFYGSTFSKLNDDQNCFRLCHELERIQRGIGAGFYPYLPEERPPQRNLIPIYVGKSPTSIPVSFALEDDRIPALIMGVVEKHLDVSSAKTKDERDAQIKQEAKRFSECVVKVIQDIFALPNLVDIDEGIVDQGGRRADIDERRFRVLPSEFAITMFKKYKANPEFHFDIDKALEQAEKKKSLPEKTLEYAKKFDKKRFEKLTTKDLRPLALYDALRTDYSCKRLEHYCHTPFEKFQPFALLTNYKKYVEAFLAFVLTEYVRKGAGVLCIPKFELDAGLKESLCDELKSWLQNHEGKGYHIEPGWANRHIDFTSGEPISLAEAVAQSNSKGGITAFKLSQWIAFWCNNFSAQMPAYHYVPEHSLAEAEIKGKIPAIKKWSANRQLNYLPGISLVNIGVGPSNAKNLTDNLAVLRPIAWLMLGHCGGLRTTLDIGDFVLAQAYVREDRVLDQELPLYVPIPEIFEITEAIKSAAEDVLLKDDVPGREQVEKGRKTPWELFVDLARGRRPDEPVPAEELQHVRAALGLRILTEAEREQVRKRLRVGTVFTTADRNWELAPLDQMIERFDKSRAVAIDMESATIAANGFRHRVFYGSLLCVSDRPLFGTIKMRGMASAFHEQATAKHLEIGIEAVKRIMVDRYRLAASRKIAGFDDPPVGSW
jgi:nucleoside phosphorylase